MREFKEGSKGGGREGTEVRGSRLKLADVAARPPPHPCNQKQQFQRGVVAGGCIQCIVPGSHCTNLYKEPVTSAGLQAVPLNGTTGSVKVLPTKLSGPPG